jgi:AcrR family transcriptional regulator
MTRERVPQVADGMDARQRILDAAERLFAERGFDGTPTSAIAVAAAVPKGLLFYYFPTKKSLLASLVTERLGDGVIDAAPLIEPGNPVASLLNLSESFFQIQAVSDVFRVILWREGHTHAEVRASLDAHRRALHATIEQVLLGSLLAPVSPARLRAAAFAWGAIVTGRPLQEPPREPGADRPIRDSRRDLTPVAELLCAGLAARPAGPALASR